MSYAVCCWKKKIALTTSNRPPSNWRMLVFVLPLRFCRIDATSNENVDWLNGVATSGAIITSNKTMFPKTLSTARPSNRMITWRTDFGYKNRCRYSYFVVPHVRKDGDAESPDV